MKKNFKYYAVIWAILLVIYNVVVLSVKSIPIFNIDFNASFVFSWLFVIAAFIGQLAVTYYAFNGESNEKLFLNIPMITESYSATVTMTVVGSVCMFIPSCPMWIASIICVAIFGLGAVSVIKAKAAGDIVSSVDEKVKNQTFFIKALTVDAETLVSKASTEEIKSELKKVYEAIRYSDPMSNNALASIESQITVTFSKLSNAVIANNSEDIKTYSNELLILMNDRNKKQNIKI